MKPATFQQAFAQIFDETFDLLVERQRKYGPENIRNQGIYGVVTRLADDKVARVRQSLKGSVVNGQVILDPIVDRESTDTFEDALKDIANYAMIALALHRGLWGLPLSDESEDDVERLIEEVDCE